MDNHQHSSPVPGFLPARMENGPITITSREIAETTEKAHGHVLRDIRAMLKGLYGVDPQDDPNPDHPGVLIERDTRRYISLVTLDREHAMTLATGYDVKLRKRVVDKLASYEAGPTRLPTPAEMFLHNAQAMVAIERQQLEHDRQIAALDAKVEKVAQTQLLTSKPQNAETITEIRKRINRRYGLSKDIVDTVMSRMTYSPKPAGMLKNEREEAKGSTYAVYWIRDVTQAFQFFVAECRMVTATQAVHPHIDSRFKLARKAGA